jgi:hypothetical protein
MPLNAEERSGRARLAAYRRHHPDKPEMLPSDAAEIEHAANDRAIDDIVARAPRMTAEQAARVGRVFKYAAPDQ